jgi:uncharacterized protein YjfI (DUF2170 family)
MSQLQKIAEEISAMDVELRGGLDFEFQPLPGEQEVLQVLVEDREELPIFLTMADNQLLCICHLFAEHEIKSDKRCDMTDLMLDMNMPMPLSSFGRTEVGDGKHMYVVFGALSLNSSAEDIALEISTLSANAIDAIEVLSEYLV